MIDKASSHTICRVFLYAMASAACDFCARPWPFAERNQELWTIIVGDCSLDKPDVFGPYEVSALMDSSVKKKEQFKIGNEVWEASSPHKTLIEIQDRTK